MWEPLSSSRQDLASNGFTVLGSALWRRQVVQALLQAQPDQGQQAIVRMQVVQLLGGPGLQQEITAAWYKASAKA